jgi:acetyl-CoA acetyltransferase family protein
MSWIAHAKRTPFAKYRGAYTSIRGEDLLAPVLNSLHTCTPVEAVYLGCANQAGEDARNVARLAALIAGLPSHLPAVTFNSLCSSSLHALEHAHMQLTLDRYQTLLVAGMEHMSRAPHAQLPPHVQPDAPVEDTRFGWRFRHPFFENTLAGRSMWEQAERLAHLHGIARKTMDEVVLLSHQRICNAAKIAPFSGGLLPISIEQDEGFRCALHSETLERLHSLTPEGLHSAAHLAAFADGAAGLVLSSAPVLFGEENCRIECLDVLNIALAPEDMPLAGGQAGLALLKRHGLTFSELACIERHEAFASALILEETLMGYPAYKQEATNRWGGALALGSPMGATGIALVQRLALRLSQEADTRRSYGLACLSSGMGLGVAVLLKWHPSPYIHRQADVASG